jgi:ATP-binding cassette subfamily B (MDR/TAP) protein 1
LCFANNIRLASVLAGLVFPGWGVAFAYMIEVLYTPVETCPQVSGDDFLGECDLYWESVADDMQQKSLEIFYGYLGILFCTVVGCVLLYWGFGVAAERMNKRVRDGAFSSLLRQEVAWFDLRSPGALASRLSDDAALLHAFAGEPIRTLVLNLSSVLVGIIISFVYMW